MGQEIIAKPESWTIENDRVKSLDGIRLMGINQNALLVDEEITKIDGEFRKLSTKIGEELKNLDSKTIKIKQKDFLKKVLPKISGKRETKDIVKELFEKYFRV